MSSILVHKCIVGLKAYTVAPCSMVMEYMPNGNLYDYLRSRNDLTWQVKLKMATNIADAMTFLHSQKPKVSNVRFAVHCEHLFEYWQYMSQGSQISKYFDG